MRGKPRGNAWTQDDLALDTLDSLDCPIAILDAEGILLAVNRAWRESRLGLSWHNTLLVGENYLLACDQGTGTGDEDLRRMAADIRAVLARERDSLLGEYGFATEAGMRWFRLRAKPLQTGGYARTVLSLDDITERKRLEAENRLLQETAESRARMLETARHVTHGFINALEEERRAVAYELHDGLTQYVMSAHAFLDTYADRYKKPGSAPMPETLEKALKYQREAVAESRRLVNGLRSLALDDMGLAGALEQLIQEEKTRAGWQESDFRHNISEQRFDHALETAIYRVAQEALANARKYAASSRIKVMLLMDRSGMPESARLILEVQDWGIGFDPEGKREQPEHLGLRSMEERVHLMHGSFEIASAPGRGTTLRAVFPVTEPTSG